MNLAEAVDAATKAGMALPEKEEDIITPPEDTRSWQGTEHGNFNGMDAAKAAKGEDDSFGRRCVRKAASLAQAALHALVLFVLHAPTKCLGVSAQVEWGNAFRSYALLSEGSLLRNMACVALSRVAYEPCEALHRLIWFLCDQMQSVTGLKGGMSRGAAVHMALSVALLFGKEIFAGDPVALLVLEAVQDVLGVQALCAFAARNTSYHSGEALQKLVEFWKSMDTDSSKEAVVSILGASFTLVKNAAVPMLMIAQCGWCPETGWPVFAATACFVGYAEITMQGMARFAVSELHRFFAYCKIVHCGQSGQKPEGVGVMQFFLDLAGRLPVMCENKIFGIHGHTNVVLGSTVCMAPLLDESVERDLLMGAGVGVFGTLDLLNDKVLRAIYDLLKRAPFITGDQGIIEVLFGPEQKWKLGPLWK